MEKKEMIRPSLLSADFRYLGKDIEEMIDLGLTHCHFDVMDGTFVEAVSFGENVFAGIKAYQDKIIFDVHLMVINPLKQVRRFISIGAKEICFHIEAMNEGDFEEYLSIRKENPDILFGIAISPDTELETIYPLLGSFDYVLVMSVYPGKGGQKFIEGSDTRIKKLDDYRKSESLSYKIGVDGGINDKTAILCRNANVDFMVAGSYYFKATDRNAALESLVEQD